MSQKLDGSCGSTPFIDADYIYFQGGVNRKELWRKKKDGSDSGTKPLYSGIYCFSKPVIDGDYVYFQGGHNEDTKQLVGAKKDGTGVIEIIDKYCSSSPTIAGQYIYFQGGPNGFGLFKKKKTDRESTHADYLNSTLFCLSSPTIDGNFVYFQGGHTEAAKELWTMKTDGSESKKIDNNCGSSPTIDGDHVYFQGGDKKDELWRRKKNGTEASEHLDRYCGSSPTIDGDYVYFQGGSNRKELYRRKKNVTGVDKSKQLASSCDSSPIIDGYYVYFRDTSNQLCSTLKYFTGTTSTWVSKLDDNLLISEINFPGTHDSAAIASWYRSPYTCQKLSITQQLASGIRILDIRLKIKKDNSNYIFITCHGDYSLWGTANEYQDFDSVLTECKEFLNKNKKETIIMSLKIDDWNGISNQDIKPLDSLKAFIEKQLGNGNLYYISKDLPQLKDIRGKIYFINRITEDLKFGVPIDWEFNSEGCYAKVKTGENLVPRSFQVYVQDKSEITDWRGPIEDKFKKVTDAFAQKKTGEILLNFASAIDVKKCGVYIMSHVLHYFGNLQNRKENFGWILFDYATEPYYVQMKNADNLRIANCVDIIIASNFKYAGYQTIPFEVKCELPPYAPRPRNFD